ncbi:MAG TPA: chromosome segregation protein SMC [Anaerolineaceae bacterium]|nr:chromosome segregation protein SMC [Anaerolineaceae bacterium]
MTETKLASLVLHGYKTFAKETNLVFPARITAIVGPNGSGKSNVADSIRWVLGEQSYSMLRAKKTEDMIYSGSENRSRAGMASVSITFDNQTNWLPIDYSEVTLTRRAYRDGQNEYLLNNQRVRLKDFHELLAKTGLADRTYTIIGQGLVDLALSIRPDERRRLFEEAAGIGLYRSRKEEALRRLETTQRNLERVSDIIEEIRPRLRSLEKQSARVGEYKLVQESLKNNLREWYGYQWMVAQSQIEGIQASLAEAESASADSKTALDADRQRIENLREEVDSKRIAIDRLMNDLRALRDEIQQQNQTIAVLDSRKRSAEESRSQLVMDSGNLEETILSEEKILSSLLAEKSRQEQELATLNERFNTANKDYEALKAQKDALDKEERLLSSKQLEAEKNVAIYRARRQEHTYRLEELKKTSETNQEKLRDVLEKKALLEQQLNSLISSISGQEKAISLLEADIEKQGSDKTALAKSLDEINRKLNALNLEKNRIVNRLELMQQSRESMEGFSEGAKGVLKAAKSKALQHEVTDLVTKLEVPEAYERAINAALGEAVDVLVVKGELDYALIKDLSGKAQERFAIIGELARKQNTQKALLDDPRVLGNAADLVKTETNLQQTIDQLLGSYLVVGEMDDALNLWGESKDANFVTLNGDVLLKNGMALLGKTNGAGKVSYSRVVKSLQQELDGIEVGLKQARELEQHGKNDIGNLEAKLQDILKHRQSDQMNLQQSRKEMNALQLELDKLNGQHNWLQQQLNTGAAQEQHLQQQLEETSGKEKTNRQESEQLKTEISNIRANKDGFNTIELEAQVHYLQTEKQVLQQALQHSKVTVISATERLENEKKRLLLYQDRLKTLEMSLAAFDRDISQGRELVDQKTLSADGLQREQLDPLRSELQTIEELNRQISQQDSENQKEFSTKERLVVHYKLEMVHHQERIESLRSRIEDDFGLIELEYKSEYSKSTPLPFPDMVIESLPVIKALPEGVEEAIRQQKNQIRRIGTVNLEAENEFHEVKERYDSLTSQTADLKDAIQDIEKLIKELDAVMREEFLKTFKAVSVEFTAMFARLFNGGSARLLLSDEESPIEGGIEIEARLPGKREQGLVLLSGGERSLTAVALVFALLRVSPTPFCVLDEVDAMLDESNVGRFLELLRDLSKDTQFVLITHNRNTVSAADVIYGVTMGKDSASQVISLQLEEVDENYVR